MTDDRGDRPGGADDPDGGAEPTEAPDDLTADAFYDALESLGRPVATAAELGRELDRSQADATDALAESRAANRLAVDAAPAVYYPEDLGAVADRERVVVFPNRREVVVQYPEQFTLARLSTFARLVTTTGEAHLYEVRDVDVWSAPQEDLGELLATIRAVCGRHPALEEFVETQYERTRKFRLRTDEDYTVLEAASDDLMGNVARQELDEELRGLISDTEAWVAEGEEAATKRTLYEAGYPVRDDREFDAGDPLDVELGLELREYQRDWVESFLDAGAGVLVGPPGSGKTVATMGVMAAVGGETLVLVPSRELAGQWRSALLEHTDLDPDQVGEYHGGQKEMAPVTIATYQTAGMDRHRSLFDSREWGLIVYDEAQHIPSPVYRTSADLQSKHRLGLSATPLREDDHETEIFTLVGPPIGTDWTALFEAGYVAEPEVEIRYVPWADEQARDQYVSAQGSARRRAAAENPAKVGAVRRLVEEHAGKTLVFVDWLDQGRAIADALEEPFVSGDTRHAERARLFEEFRRGDRDVLVVSRVGDEGIDLPDAELAVVASGLGGSRRQGTQRAGRTMRPAGRARMVVLATRGSVEEEFARKRTRHLAGKGVRVTERAVEASADDEAATAAETVTDEGGSDGPG